MDKKKIELLTRASDIFPRLKSYSIEEIMAAGGPDKFAEKLGKSADLYGASGKIT
jgi:hypothetical protein